MEQIVTPARKLTGTVTVPGELGPSVLSLVFAAVAEGTSRIRNAPPSLEPLLDTLRQLGVRVRVDGRDLTVQGHGLFGFRQPEGILRLKGLGEEVMPLVAALACQKFASRLEADWSDSWPRLREALSSMGCSLEWEEEGLFRIEASRQLSATAHDSTDMEPLVKLSIAQVARAAQGTTSWIERAKGRDWAVRFLRQRFEVVRRRQEGSEDYEVLIEGDQPLGPVDVEIPGDLRLAYPFIVAAVGLKGSDLKIRNVAIHPGRRTLLDTMRQIGAPITIAEGEEEGNQIQVQAGGLKSTRIAGKRTDALIEHVALVAVLATQAQGQFVIRDLKDLRSGPHDGIAHLVSVLRGLGARVGEFDEGIVIDGGLPLKGDRIETNGDPNLALAAAVAGLLADGDVTVVDSDCIDRLFPGFFDEVEACKENKK